MGIILKHTFRNIFKKPARTFLLAFCIFLCSMAAALCLDMTQSVRRLFANTFSDMVGSTDIEYIGYEPLDENSFSELPENRALFLGSGYTVFYRRDPQLYSYATATNVAIMGTDLAKAYDMRILPVKLELSADETAMTKDLAELLGYSAGDRVYFYDDMGEKQEFVIKELIERGGLVNQRDVCVVSSEGLCRLFSSGEVTYYYAMIDVIDNGKINEAEAMLKEAHPEADTLNITNNREAQEAIDQISKMFIMFFVVCLLVVIIITVTVSERIISERMSVVGTLRSLGVSQTKTALILLLENAVYALIGSVPAVLAYEAVRPMLLDTLFVVDDVVTPDFGQVSRLMEAGIVLGAVVLECACTLKEIIKASRTAIRDIIFLNKDTEYRFSPAAVVTGLAFAAAALVTALIPDSFTAMIICFISTILAVFLLFPFVTVYASRGLEKLFARLNMPVARLAAAEAGSKKSTAASAQLISAVASISVLLFVVTGSLYDMSNKQTIDADYVMSGLSEGDYMYDYIDDIEGVTATENVYVSMYVYAEFNGTEEKNFCVFGYDGQEMFKGVEGLPDAVGRDEFYMDKGFADRLGLSIGEEVDILMNSDSFIPRHLMLRLSGYCNSVYFDGRGKSIVINKELYTEEFCDYPYNILIDTDGTNDAQIADMINKYSSATMTELQSIEEMNEQIAQESHAENTLIKMIGFMGIFLVFVGVVSNQLIGFESRKRECAVLISVAMEKRTLRKMLLLETVISSALPLIISLPLGLVISLPIFKIMHLLELSLPWVVNMGELLLLEAGLLAVFSLTVIFPYWQLHRMKPAEQLKYE